MALRCERFGIVILCLAGWIAATAEAAFAQQRIPARASPGATLDRETFRRAVQRVTSPSYRLDRNEERRRAAIDRQVDLEALVQWRSGIVPGIVYSGLSPSAGFGLAAASAAGLPAAANFYSPFYSGPFEPTPLWPGYIFGAPSVNPVEQPVGHRITPLGPGGTDGYVYEPVYRNDALRAAEGLEPRNAEPQAASGPQVNPPGPAVEDRPATSPVARKYLALAVEAFGRGDYAAALRELDHLDVEARDHAPAELLRAQAFFALGDYRLASDALHRALAGLPEPAWGLVVGNYLDYYLLPQGMTTQLRALERFIGEHPNDARARFVLGYEYGFLGYPAEAVAQFERALKQGLRYENPRAVVPEEVAEQDMVAMGLVEHFRQLVPRAQRRPRPEAKGPREF